MIGTAPATSTMQAMDSLLNPSPSLFTTLLKKPLWAIQFLSQAIPFLLRNKESIALPRILAFHRALRDTPTAEAEGLKVGSAGFCWGGKYSILLTHARAEDEGRGGLVDAAFVAHPKEMAFPSEWEKIDRPFSMAIGDVDMGIGIGDVRRIKGLLEGERRGIEAEVRVYEGARHGFAVRADKGDEGQSRSAVGAKEQALGWFGRWLV